MNGEVSIYSAPAAPATAAQIRAHVNLIQQVMQAVMKRETHYGVIPGTPKPSLYKPGAEVLCATFHIAPTYRTEDLSTADCVRYRVTCVGIHQGTGTVLGEGVGECSSNEEKYRWRKPKSPAEFDAFPEDRKRLKYERDGTQRQVRVEPADVANTILKMAAKRAQVAMTLNVTAASDIFTQDIEDLPEGLREEATPAGDPALADRWVARANGAETSEALKAIWSEGLKETKAAKDLPAYNALKAAVEARAAALKAAAAGAPAAREGAAA